MKKYLILSLILIQSSQTFAICEHERGQRDHFQRLCDVASGASVTGAVAGNLVVPLLGGIIFGGLFAGPAFAACTDRDFWQSMLKQCERNAIREQEERNRAEAERQGRIVEINSRYDTLGRVARDEFHAHMQRFTHNLLEQGDLDNLTRVEEEQRNQQQILETRLREIEEQRQAELHRV